MDILTRKRLLVDIFVTRRLSKSIAFCEFASVNFRALDLVSSSVSLLGSLFVSVPVPLSSFFFLTRSRLIAEQVHKQRLVLCVVLVLSALRLFSRLSCRKINECILYHISFHQGVNEESGQKRKGEGPMGER